MLIFLKGLQTYSSHMPEKLKTLKKLCDSRINRLYQRHKRIKDRKKETLYSDSLCEEQTVSEH